MGDYVGLLRLSEAETEMDRAHKLGLDGSTDFAGANFPAYFFLQQPDGMQKMLAQVTGRPDEFLVIQAMAYTQQFSGRYRQANDTVRQVFELAEHEKAPDVQAGTTLSHAEARGLAGLCEGNASAGEQGLVLDKNKQNQETAVLAAAVCGNNKASLPWRSISVRDSLKTP